MATGYLDLFPGGVAPDGSGSGNDPAALAYEVSGAAQGTNSPKVAQYGLVFHATTDTHWLFSGTLPGDWASGLTLRGKLKFESDTSGNAFMKAAVVFTTDSSTDDDALAFGTADVSSAIAAPGTQGQMVEFTIALTLSGAAAGRKYVLMLGHDADHASKTIAGRPILPALRAEYTTS